MKEVFGDKKNIINELSILSFIDKKLMFKEEK